MKLLTKKEVKHKVLRTIGRGFLLLVLIALVPLCYILPRILIKGAAAEFYARNIFPIVSFIPLSINNMLMTSLTELAVVVGSFALIIMIVAIIIKAIKMALTRDAHRVGHYLYVVLRTAAVLGIAAALIFSGMLGINYNRVSVRKSMTLYGETRPYEDYEQTLIWAYNGMIAARNQMGEDYNGVAHMQTSFEASVYEANVAVTSFADYYNLGLSHNYVRAKPVMLSNLWRYTDIVGAYDPFLGEVNLNTDYLDVLHFPVTLCHEMVHAKGYGSETDANTIAVLSCINSPRPDFRYAGYYYIFMRLWGEVAEYASHEGVVMIDFAARSDFNPVRRDIIAYNDYCESFENGPIADFISRFSEDVNNAYLESNGQQGGTDTYVVPQDSYVEFFCRYVRTDA